MDNRTEFMREQQRAIERMREMSRNAAQTAPHTMPPAPSFVQVNGRQSSAPDGRTQPMHENAKYADNAGYASVNAQAHQQQANTPPKNGADSRKTAPSGTSLLGIDLPILDRIKNEPDMTLVLGILLLLWSEKADKKLLLALLYILF